MDRIMKNSFKKVHTLGPFKLGLTHFIHDNATSRKVTFFCSSDMAVTDIRHPGFILALLYFMQITAVPISHYYLHLAEVTYSRSHQLEHLTYLPYHGDKKDKSLVPHCQNKRRTENEHSSHEPTTWSLCSGTHNVSSPWFQMSFSPYKLSISGISPNHDKPILSHIYSSKIPRAPPVLLS